MDEGTRGLGAGRPPAPSDESTSPAAEARALEQQVDAIRDELGDLVGELDRRRHRAAKPIAVGGLLIAVAALAGTGLLLWHSRRKAVRRSLGLSRLGWARALLLNGLNGLNGRHRT